MIFHNSNRAEYALTEHLSTLHTNDNDSNNIWNIPDPLNVFVLKIIEIKDPPAAHKDLQQARKVEVDGPVSKKIWHKVSLHSVP